MFVIGSEIRRVYFELYFTDARCTVLYKNELQENVNQFQDKDELSLFKDHRWI